MERQLYGTIKVVFGPRKNISEKFQEALPGGLGQHTKLQNSLVSKATSTKTYSHVSNNQLSKETYF